MKDNDKKVLVVGEFSEKIRFIEVLLGTSAKNTLRDKLKIGIGEIIVKGTDRFCDCISLTAKGLEILSPMIPFGVSLILDSSEDEWTTFANENVDMALFVEGYPFTTESLLENLLGIKDFLDNRASLGIVSSVSFRVLFHKERNRRFAAGDLVGIDEALRKAPDEMRRRLAKRRSDGECCLPLDELVDFTIFSKPADIPKALVFTGKALKFTVAMCQDSFRRWQDSKYLFDMEYAISLTEYSYLTDPEILHHKVLRFEQVKGSNDIAGQYAKSYYKAFAGRLYELVSNFYKDHIAEICFWNMELDLKRLEKRLDDLYSERLNSVGKTKYRCPSNREEYNNLCSTTHIDIHFSSAVNEFVKTAVAELIKKHLDEKEAALTGILVDDAVSV